MMIQSGGLKSICLFVMMGYVLCDEEWTESEWSRRNKRAEDVNYYEDVMHHHRQTRQAAAIVPDFIINSPSGPNTEKLRVVTILEQPYTMVHPQTNTMIGFIPELFQMLSLREQLSFSLYVVGDGKYGYQKADGQWVGMVGELIKRQHEPDNEDGADIVGAPLTMSAAREEHIDFLNPFKSLGLVMTVKKTQPHDYMPVNFAVTDPLSTEVWLICTCSTILVGLLLFGINQLNPYEWSGRYSLGRASEIHSETFNLSGSLWFAFTTLQWQGYDRAPRSIASRILAAFWFTFVSITMITYTASLVNYLFWASTVHGKDYTKSPILDLNHLVMSDRYKYGCVKGGSTYKYLTDTRRGEVFSKMKEFLEDEKNSDNLVSGVAEGFDRVRKEENYVFIAEEPTALHEINKRPCDISISGKSFAPRSYSMAHRNNLAPEITNKLHKAILEMIEDGTMEALESRWFVDQGQCWNVTQIERITAMQTSLNLNKPKQITLEQYWGPFALIIAGFVLSIAAAVGETLYYKYKGRYEPGNRPGSTQLRLEDEGI